MNQRGNRDDLGKDIFNQYRSPLNRQFNEKRKQRSFKGSKI
jgi:hypothetical protein